MTEEREAGAEMETAGSGSGEIAIGAMTDGWFNWSWMSSGIFRID